MKIRDLFAMVLGAGAALAYVVSTPSPASFVKMQEAEAAPQACTYLSSRSQVISSTTPQHAPAGDAGANTFGGGTFNAAGQLVGRAYVTYCVPPTNAGGAQPTGLTVKVRADGALPGVPTDGGTDPSVVLAINQCASFAVSSSIAPYALSSIDGGQLNTTECVAPQ